MGWLPLVLLSLLLSLFVDYTFGSYVMMVTVCIDLHLQKKQKQTIKHATNFLVMFQNSYFLDTVYVQNFQILIEIIKLTVAVSN